MPSTTSPQILHSQQTGGGSTTAPGYSKEYVLSRSLNYLHHWLATQHNDANARLILDEFDPDLTLLAETDMTTDIAQTLVDWKVFELGALDVAALLVEVICNEVHWSKSGREEWTVKFVARMVDFCVPFPED